MPGNYSHPIGGVHPQSSRYTPKSDPPLGGCTLYQCQVSNHKPGM